MQTYLSFLAFATVLAAAPGPDTFFTLRATVAGGRSRGLWTMGGILAANTVQAAAVVTGLGAVIAASEPVFATIKWAGVAYLVYLGTMAIIAAVRAGTGSWQVGSGGQVTPATAMRQGFLCNITNPKVLAFNLAVLPQFVSPDASVWELAVYAGTLTVVGMVVLALVVFGASGAARMISRPGFRRGVDGGVGVVMLGFAGALAAES